MIIIENKSKFFPCFSIKVKKICTENSRGSVIYISVSTIFSIQKFYRLTNIKTDFHLFIKASDKFNILVECMSINVLKNANE